MTAAPYLLRRPSELRFHRIGAGDTVRLAPLLVPADGVGHSVFLEVWEPGGAQPPNSHPRSVETFQFLAGRGVAESDGHEVPVAAGDLLVLPAGTVHRIRAVGSRRLYALTTMVPDDGFAALVLAGPVVPGEPGDAAVLARE